MNKIATEKMLVLIALFLIVSAKPVYNITSAVFSKVGLPTIQYGVPTRVGLVLHAVVLAVLYGWIANKI